MSELPIHLKKYGGELRFKEPEEIIETTEDQYVMEIVVVKGEVARYRSMLNGRTRKVGSCAVPETALLASINPQDITAWGEQIERWVADNEREAKATFEKMDDEREASAERLKGNP